MIAMDTFGRTGHLSTRTIFGAAALGRVTQEEADRTLEVLLQFGVNHIDTAASYGNGQAEMRIGPWMGRYRQQFFLATKTNERTYQTARDQFHASLERLRVDSVDLLQLHNLTDPAEWEVALGSGGALEAAVEAREQGLTRFIGVTGHGLIAPSIHRRSLERFDFDTVLLPYNFVLMQNPQYAEDFDSLQALCRQRNVPVQTIKSLARGPLGEKPRVHGPWYDPLVEQPDIELAGRYVLGRPGIFLNTSADIYLLPMLLEAASRFQEPPTDSEMAQLVARQGMTPLFV